MCENKLLMYVWWAAGLVYEVWRTLSKLLCIYIIIINYCTLFWLMQMGLGLCAWSVTWNVFSRIFPRFPRQKTATTKRRSARNANQDMSLSVKTRDGKLWGTDDKGLVVKRRLYVCHIQLKGTFGSRAHVTKSRSPKIQKHFDTPHSSEIHYHTIIQNVCTIHAHTCIILN